MRAIVTSVVLLVGCGGDPAVTAPDASPDVLSASCTDGTKNADETDVDCGGSCGACVAGRSCAVDDDCGDGTCFAGTCAPRMWFATSSGSNLVIPAATTTWTPATGLSVNAQLYEQSLVVMRMTGTLRYGGGGNGICHVAERFNVDGTATGDATWGDAITVLNGAVRWHVPFVTETAKMLPAGMHTIAAEMTNGTGNATCNLDGDSGLAYDRSHIEVIAYDPGTAWYAESTAGTGALAGGSPWTDIPGVVTNFTLPDRLLVQASLTGTQYAGNPGTATSSHCAYRLVLDDVPVGDPNHGQAISVGDVAGGWWAPVSIKWGLTLAAGGHTLRAQVRNSGAVNGTCEAGEGNHGYSRFRLLVTATPTAGANAAIESSGPSQYFPAASPWTAVTGLQTTIDTGRSTPSTVQFEISGTQRTLATGASYCAYRLVVDDVPLGHANHGQAISVGDSTNAWWSYIGMSWGTLLAPGPHVVKVEARNSSAAGDCGVNGDDKGYGRLRMLVRNL